MARIINGFRFIKSRDDFFRVLAQATAETKALVAQDPTYAPFESIDMQLDAIARWTANGRQPAKDERVRITIGMISVRELQPAADAAMEDYLKRLSEITSYFKMWPSDDEFGDIDDNDWRVFFPDDYM